jgi:hypothetical protein
MPIEPRYTVTLRELSIDDVCSLAMEIDPHRTGRRGWIQQRALREVIREERRCREAYQAWKAQRRVERHAD